MSWFNSVKEILDDDVVTNLLNLINNNTSDITIHTTAIANHTADNAMHSRSGTTTGSANTYVLTLSPAPTALVDNFCVAVKINVANTGASTLNVNGLGAKPIVNSYGTAVTFGDLVLNSVYTLRYNGTSFVIQGDGVTKSEKDSWTNHLPLIASSANLGHIKTKFVDGNGVLQLSPDFGRFRSAFGWKNEVMTDLAFNSATGEYKLPPVSTSFSQTVGTNTKPIGYYSSAMQGVGLRFDGNTHGITRIKNVTAISVSSQYSTSDSAQCEIYDITSAVSLGSAKCAYSTTGQSTLTFAFGAGIEIDATHTFEIRFTGNAYANLKFNTTLALQAGCQLVTGSISGSSSNWTWPTTGLTYASVGCPYIIIDASRPSLTGNVVMPLTPKDIMNWGSFKWEQTVVTNASVSCDILDASNNVLKSGVTSVADISDINDTTCPTLKAKLTLTRTSTAITSPTVKNPSYTWEAPALDHEWEKIASVTLKTGQSQIDFANISSEYRYLKIKYNFTVDKQFVNVSSAYYYTTLLMKLNDDVTSTYYYTTGSFLNSLQNSQVGFPIGYAGYGSGQYEFGEGIIHNLYADKAKFINVKRFTDNFNYGSGSWSIYEDISGIYSQITSLVNKISLLLTNAQTAALFLAGSSFELWGAR